MQRSFFTCPARRAIRPGGVALVTGAAGGIGRALAHALVDRGMRVVLADRDVDGALSTAKALDVGSRALAVALDVTDANAFHDVVAETWAREGAIDVLVNNAGVGLAGEVPHTRLDDWQRVIDVNLWGTVHGVRSVYPRMVDRRAGVILNVASGAGLCPRPGMVPYAAAKHAVVGLSTSLRAEAAAYGVGVHALCPGYVRTAIMDRTVYRGVDPDKLRAAIPIQPVTAAFCAEVAVTGMLDNRSIIPVSRATTFEWLLWRAAPGLVDRIATLRARAFRSHAGSG